MGRSGRNPMYLFEPDLLYGPEHRPHRKEANPEKNGLERTSSPSFSTWRRYEMVSFASPTRGCSFVLLLYVVVVVVSCWAKKDAKVTTEDISVGRA